MILQKKWDGKCEKEDNYNISDSDFVDSLFFPVFRKTTSAFKERRRDKEYFGKLAS